MPRFLPLHRYTFTVRTEQPLRLPDFAGSMLRGVFGNALRRVTCMTRMTECTGCPLLATCPYSQIFATPPLENHALQKFSAMPNPYVIEPPEGGARTLQTGESFNFSLVLIGKALQQLPLIILAWERALEKGLGKTRSRCTLVEVHCEGQEKPIYLPGSRVLHHETTRNESPLTSSVMELHFTTPLRLQQKGKTVGLRELDARTLLIALARRYQLLCDTQLERPEQIDFAALSNAASNIQLHADMVWRDWTRYSSRQQQAMTLGGLLGSIRLSGDLAPFIALLDAGQWIHLGKEAVFGLGRYQLQAGIGSCKD